MGTDIDMAKFKNTYCPCCSAERKKAQNPTTNKEDPKEEIKKKVLETSITDEKTAASLRATPPLMQNKSQSQITNIDPNINNNTSSTLIQNTSTLNNNSDKISNVSRGISNNETTLNNNIFNDRCCNCKSRNADCYIMSCNHALCNSCFDAITNSMHKDIICPFCKSSIIGRTEKRF